MDLAIKPDHPRELKTNSKHGLQTTLRDLFGHSMVYSIAILSSTVVGVLLLPVYTRYLDKTDYGILEILDYFNLILQIVAFTGLNAAVPRFFNEEEDAPSRRSVISTATISVIAAGALVCAGCLMFRSQLALLTLGSRDYSSLLALSVTVLFLQMIVNIGTVGLITIKKTNVFVMYMIARLAINVIANLYFIVFLGLGAAGMLYGNLTANVLVALAMAAHTFVLNGFAFRLKILMRLYCFGAPLIPATILATLMHNADRFMIRYYQSLDAVGIYSLGYKFPFLLNALLMQSVGSIWMGRTMYDVSREADSSYQFKRIMTYIVSAYVMAQLAMSLAAVPLIRLLAAPKFFPAHEVIPLVAFGLCFHAFDTFFSVEVYLQKKTYLRIVAYLPPALINIVGNAIFLPRYGYMAAAWISVLTYAVFAAAAFWSSRHLHRVEFEGARIFKVFVAAISVFFIASLFTFESMVLEIAKACAFLGFFAAILVAAGWLTQGEKTFIRERCANVIDGWTRRIHSFGH
jgi:O-antigen/teichoic acid export membrane protein